MGNIIEIIQKYVKEKGKKRICSKEGIFFYAYVEKQYKEKLTSQDIRKCIKSDA